MKHLKTLGLIAAGMAIAFGLVQVRERFFAPASSNQVVAAPGTAPAGPNASASLDYGPLGPPHNDLLETYKGDKPAANLQTVRDHIGGVVSDPERMVTWDEIMERDAGMRAVFYDVWTTNPELVTPADVKAMRDYEAQMLSGACANYDPTDLEMLESKVSAQFFPKAILAKCPAK